MRIAKNEHGFSLVESLVASTIALIVGFVIYTIAIAYTNESSSSVSFFMIQQQYDNVVSQIEEDVHRASFVVAVGETPDVHATTYDTVSAIILFDAGKQIITQYSITDSILYEGKELKRYESGGATVNVVEGKTNFIITPQRNALILNVALSKKDRHTTFTLPCRESMFVCRN